MKFGRLIWGFIILIVGVLLLGINFGWWSSDIFFQLLSLWPVLIILIGLSIALGSDNPLLAVLTLIIILLSVILVIRGGDINGNRIINSRTQESVSGKLNSPITQDLTKVTFNIDIGAASMRIGETDKPETLFEGDYSLSGLLSPEQNVVVNYNDNEAKVEINEDFKATPFFRRGNNRRELNLLITDKFPLDLNLASGASKLNLDLSQLKVQNLDIDAGASSADIRFGGLQDNVKATLDMGASSIRILVPKDFGIKITLDGALVSNNFSASNLSKDGNTYTSSEFETAPKKITLEIKAGAATINIDRY